MTLGELPWSVGEIIAIITLVGAAFGGYWRLVGKITHLEDSMRMIAERNKLADLDAEVVKTRQSHQETTIAVMAANMTAMANTLERIDRNVEEIIKKRSG